MKFRQLLDTWAESSEPARTETAYAVHLPLDDAARIEALAELFPGRTREQIITDLLSAALRELQAAMPYVRGDQVISRDEQGDPIYGDAGLSPRFLALARKHRGALDRG